MTTIIKNAYISDNGQQTLIPRDVLIADGKSPPSPNAVNSTT